MGEVKRWNVESDDHDGPCSLWNIESTEGEFVTYEDYAALKAELDAECNHTAVVLGPPTYWHQDGGKLQYTIETSETLKHGTELFTRPARAADLAGLVPDKWSLEQALKFVEDYTPPSEEESVLFAVNSFRATILRNIEEAK